MNSLPILKSLLSHHKTASVLIIIEIALSCAIVCNAVFIIGERLDRMHRQSGVAESELSRVQLTNIDKDSDPSALTTRDLASLRALPGVKSATIVNQIPFGGSSWNSGVFLDPEGTRPIVNATMYMAGPEFIDTLGLHLVAGKNFADDAYLKVDPKLGFMQFVTVRDIIITRALAHRLFPKKSAVGETFYFGTDDPVRVVGVIDHLVRPREFERDPTFEYTMILPARIPYSMGGSYVIRTAPEDRDKTLAAAVEVLEKNSPNRIVLNQQTFEEIRADYFRSDRAMAWLLLTVCVALLIVTALGIVGLASFWVQQRTRQIGVRRALGATRTQILRYFQTENLLLTTAGIVAGMALAYGINMWLMDSYALPRLPAMVLPIGAVTLWVLGQLAVLGPARRASTVPPAVATRSV